VHSRNKSTHLNSTINQMNEATITRKK
jgi:hypothetical protein